MAPGVLHFQSLKGAKVQLEPDCACRLAGGGIFENGFFDCLQLQKHTQRTSGISVFMYNKSAVKLEVGTDVSMQ